MSNQALYPPKSGLITTGLALFSMFFGAGNLIFPLLIGKSVGDNVWYAMAGLSITAIVVPFLGLIAMVLFQADYNQFFGRIGKIPSVLLLLLLQLILGPFGVIPRLVTLMHATAAPYLGNLPLSFFSLIVVAILFVVSFQRGRLISFLGAYLTPILLLSLSALIFSGIYTQSTSHPSLVSSWDSFLQGLVGGYNTMDLIAAFLFATVVLPHFQIPDSRTLSKPLLKKISLSSLLAAGLLLFTYIGLSLVSSRHGQMVEAPSEQLLQSIACKLLGSFGGSIAAISVITACFTTALTLVSIFADYLRKDLCKEKINQNTALVFTLTSTTLFSNLGFAGISAFLSPILQIIYPALILLTIFNLFHALYGYRTIKLPMFFVCVSSAIVYFA